MKKIKAFFKKIIVIPGKVLRFIKRVIFAIFKFIKNLIGAKEITILVALSLIVSGLKDVYPPAALIAPGVILLYIVLRRNTVIDFSNQKRG